MKFMHYLGLAVPAISGSSCEIREIMDKFSPDREFKLWMQVRCQLYPKIVANQRA